MYKWQIAPTGDHTNLPMAASNSNSNPNPQPLYPTIDTTDLATNLFPDNPSPSPSPSPSDQTLILIPGATLHLIDPHRSVDLGSGDFTVTLLLHGRDPVAVLAGIPPHVHWPLTADQASVRLDSSHYFFSLPSPDGPLSYGLTFASLGQDELLARLDSVLASYTNFSTQDLKISGDVLEGKEAKGTRPEEAVGERRERIEREAAAYWTTIAPNVEEYSGSVARLIAKGSGQVVRGILWCGDVTVERLRWGNQVLMKRMGAKDKEAEISPEALKRIQRVKKMTKMSEKLASGVLSGVLKVSGFFTSSIVNSKAGKKFFGLLPGEIVLATLDGFGKVCDAVEVAGKNVMSTSSTVTTGLVTHRYGQQAGEATSEGMDAAGHAMGTAWAVFKIRQALNPKSVMKPTTLVKSAAAAEMKAKKK